MSDWVNGAFHWLNTNAGAVQAITSVVLALITTYYAIMNHWLTNLTNDTARSTRYTVHPVLGGIHGAAQLVEALPERAIQLRRFDNLCEFAAP